MGTTFPGITSMITILILLLVILCEFKFMDDRINNSMKIEHTYFVCQHFFLEMTKAYSKMNF